MLNAAERRNSWLIHAGLIVAAVTLMRVILLALNRTDLFVDEAQYWFWGQEMAWGYYSKPPMIGWVIRASTEIGSDAPFWVRLPGPLFHGVTAMILAAIAARRIDPRAAVWVAGLYVTLPMVTVGSALIGTDTIMFPFLATALLAWLRVLDGGAMRWSVVAGAALGIAFLSKYAAMYFVLCAGLATVLPQGRASWRAAVVAALAFVVVISPNLFWNLANGLSTLEHTLDNADWVRDPGARAGLNLSGLGTFLASQFLVFGPVLFGALAWVSLKGGAPDPIRRLMLVFSLPILVLVCVQALLAEAYPNWAAATYLAGLLAVVPWLLRKPRFWLWSTVILHGAFALFIPVATWVGTGWSAASENRLLLERYLGRSEMSARILELAESEGLPVVADDRDVLADLFYANRAGVVPVYALPERGRASNHYALTRSLPADVTGPVLFVTKRGAAPLSCNAKSLGLLAPQTGAYRTRPQAVFRLEASCLRP